MNSSIISILEILNAAVTLSSVGFSAGYTFNAKDAQDYFTELIEMANYRAPIFSGIIIIEKSNRKGSFTVIDGLQRVTSLSLILSALCASAKNTTKKNEDARYKIFTRYLTNDTDVKLQLIGAEQEIYRKIVFSLPLSEQEMRSNIYKAYQTFLECILEQKISTTNLFKIISKIQFMTVFTENSKFSAREFYQSLNSSKNDLSQINLISSFISQNCENSYPLWIDAMNLYKNQGLIDVFKSFVKDFLTVQNNGSIPCEKSLYNSFKNFYYRLAQYQPGDVIVQNIYKYARFYLQILRSDFEDFEVQKQFIMINENGGQDAYSYLMEVLDDVENGHIQYEVFLDILNMVNAFITNRKETGDDTISFANLSNELNRMIAMKNYPSNDESSFEDENKITINDINQLSAFEV